MGEKLYYTGSSETITGDFDGDKLVHGQQGEVLGPANSESVKGKGLSMQFPGNKGGINCRLTSLSRSPPVRAACVSVWRRVGGARLFPVE